MQILVSLVLCSSICHLSFHASNIGFLLGNIRFLLSDAGSLLGNFCSLGADIALFCPRADFGQLCLRNAYLCFCLSQLRLQAGCTV